MATTFLLIRHALNDWVDRRIAGWTPGVHLNEVGRSQAERLAERLRAIRLHAIYASPLDRTLETAAPIARRLGLEVQVREEFGEIRYGDWTGLSVDELRQRKEWKQFLRFRSGTRVPGGELMVELQVRMVAGMERLRVAHPDQTVAIVSHGDPIRTALAHYLGMAIDLYPRLAVDPASVSIVAIGDEGARILRLNDTGELPSAAAAP